MTFSSGLRTVGVFGGEGTMQQQVCPTHRTSPPRSTLLWRTELNQTPWRLRTGCDALRGWSAHKPRAAFVATLQLSELSRGCDLLIATPGRLNDLADR
jgi:hypothetical protein